MKKEHPKIRKPKLPLWILTLTADESYDLSAAGDLEELYEDKLNHRGRFSAFFWLWRQVLRSVPVFIIHSIMWRWVMFKNYVKIALRNLKKHRVYSLINIAGLSVSMACFILISVWVLDELSYDRFHENKERIFKMITQFSSGRMNTTSSWALGPALKEKYPEIVDYSRIWFWHRSLVKYQDKHFDEEKFYLADPSIFRMFSFPFVRGNPENALSNMNSIVITEETAERYFGDDDPIGKVLHVVQNDADFTVTGVIKNIARNSHMQFDLLARIELMGRERLESWEYTGYTYVMLGADIPAGNVNEKIKDFYRDYVDPEWTATPILQPLTKVHLYQFGKPGIIKHVYIFSIIAIFILIIACINFMNLSTARSSRRAKEVGIRKVSGATRMSLVKQFLGESILFSFLALIFALLLVALVLPSFNSFTGKSLSLMDDALGFMLLLLGVATLTGFLAGSYPAVFLSSFKPAEAIKRQLDSGSRRSLFRKVLVIFQFSISTGLIICTTLVYKQLHFIQKRDLGFDRNYVVTIKNNPDLQNRFDMFKSALLNEQGIINATSASTRPTYVGQGIEIRWEGGHDEEYLSIRYAMVDYDFFKTFDMELVQGRSFSKVFALDENEACIINETALREMGIESPIGKDVFCWLPAGLDESFRNVKIIGVVKDFHFRSMHEAIGPFLFRMYRPWHHYIFIKIRSDDIQETLLRTERVFKRFAPEYPFQYEFLDEAFNRLYQSERQMGQLFNIFGFLAVLISCLGLFGLASYTAEQKTKEIGVRKVLGASVSEIILLLSKEFTKWVLIANAIAWPVCYFIMNRWLQNFAYKTRIGIETFMLSGMIAFLIALLTVSYQSIKAAQANPAESLKYE